MIGMLISAGSGLVLGISLLIWGLKERSKRHAAELTLESTRQLVKEVQGANERLRAEITVIRQDRDSCDVQLQVLRNALAGLYEKLAKCKDPEVVKQILNDALGEQL